MYIYNNNLYLTTIRVTIPDHQNTKATYTANRLAAARSTCAPNPRLLAYSL